MPKGIKIKAKRADSIIDKTRGVMFSETIKPLHFGTRWGVHTFFVRKPIYVLVLDHNSLVVHKKLLNPWRVFYWNPKYSRVLELPIDYPGINKVKEGSKCILDLYQ